MSTILYYAKNDTGKKLAKNISSTITKTDVREEVIAGQTHLKITIPVLGPNNATVEINEPSAIKLALNKSGTARVHNLNRLAVDEEENGEKIVREYKITILNLHPIKVTRKDNTTAASREAGWKPVDLSEEREREIRKVLTSARIAVQSLGLDFASVHLGLNKLLNIYILSVDPSPTLGAARIEKLARFAIEYLTGEWVSSEVMLGADPEFMMLENNKDRLILASTFFPRHGDVGCDNLRVRNRQQRPIAELRPAPSPNPLILTDNIRRTMVQALKLAPYRNIRWLAGSLPVDEYPIGGHIHFSKIALSSKLVRALDNYLAIPVMLMENPETSVKRRKKYGLLSDFRVKEYGGFEYRTLSSWIIDPTITRGVLSMAKVIALNYLQLKDNIFTTPEAHEAFYKGDKSYFMDYYYYMWKKLISLPGAYDYVPYMQTINELCRSPEGWDEFLNIRETWDLPDVKKVYREKSSKKNSSARVSVRVR
ncbi:MAG: putative amidoligase domain-containing protein [Candidatus Saccharibacteria bacterium]